jgi:hypothetical protein
VPSPWPRKGAGDNGALPLRLGPVGQDIGGNLRLVQTGFFGVPWSVGHGHISLIRG